MTGLEKMARAIWQQRQFIAARQAIPLPNWDDENELQRNDVLDECRVVIAVLRHPTQAMFDKACDVATDMSDHAAWWEAMLDGIEL